MIIPGKVQKLCAVHILTNKSSVSVAMANMSLYSCRFI